jgi:hypothetical protein
MNSHSRHLAAFAAFAAASMLPAATAQAQYFGGTRTQPAPLYPYAVQNSYGVQADQPYAVEVAPNTYVIQRSAPARAYPYVSSRRASNPTSEQGAPASDRPRKPADRGLIEELRNRSHSKGTVVNTTKIVRDPPIVIETKRVVDDPPRVIERRHIVEDVPVRSRRTRAAVADDVPNKGASRDDTKRRVIQADAEITILGPDRMSIRLFRKGHNAKASAQDE